MLDYYQGQSTFISALRKQYYNNNKKGCNVTQRVGMTMPTTCLVFNILKVQYQQQSNYILSLESLQIDQVL